MKATNFCKTNFPENQEQAEYKLWKETVIGISEYRKIIKTKTNKRVKKGDQGTSL